MGDTDIDPDLAEVNDRVRMFPEPPLRRRWSAADIVRLLGGLLFLAAGLLAASVALLEGSNFLSISNGWFGLLVICLYLLLINFKTFGMILLININ